MSLLESCKDFAILSETSMIGLPSYCKVLTVCVRLRSASHSFLAFSPKADLSMSGRASLLCTLENQSLSVDSRAELCCEAASKFENKGQYDEACKVLRDYWQRIGEDPKLDGLEPSTAAEILLRAGVLTGIIGA